MMITDAETFLVKCLAKNATLSTFDELREEMYHAKSFKLDLERLPATTASMKLHIQRSYFQAYLWFHAPFEEVVDVNPVEYGYAVDEEDHLFPVVTYGKNVPDGFSDAM